MQIKCIYEKSDSIFAWKLKLQVKNKERLSNQDCVRMVERKLVQKSRKLNFFENFQIKIWFRLKRFIFFLSFENDLCSVRLLIKTIQTVLMKSSCGWKCNVIAIIHKSKAVRLCNLKSCLVDNILKRVYNV